MDMLFDIKRRSCTILSTDCLVIGISFLANIREIELRHVPAPRHIDLHVLLITTCICGLGIHTHFHGFHHIQGAGCAIRLFYLDLLLLKLTSRFPFKTALA